MRQGNKDARSASGFQNFSFWMKLRNFIITWNSINIFFPLQGTIYFWWVIWIAVEPTQVFNQEHKSTVFAEEMNGEWW